MAKPQKSISIVSFENRNYVSVFYTYVYIVANCVVVITQFPKDKTC